MEGRMPRALLSIQLKKYDTIIKILISESFITKYKYIKYRYEKLFKFSFNKECQEQRGGRIFEVDSKALLESLTVIQVVKKCPFCYRNHKSLMSR
jgi:hypothetical protein